MARKKTTAEPMNGVKTEIIMQKTMESVMHESMMPYSEHVILERALPRVEDGLKPVQRRILYTMQELALSPDKPHRKCARIVGDCLGKYHPHGDSSVYGALARMAQDFSLRATLVDGHGNFGSIDGDSPAAMRYTEARMTPLAMEMLKDIEKDTVDFHLNFDDTLNEPDLLPGAFPNLLVNGADGIAVGLATNIPPHNLGETIDGAVALLDNPKLTTRELMQYIPGPDFPTGGVMAAGEDLLQAYETGRGKVPLRAKINVEDGSAGRKLLVITEMTYGKNKAAVLEKILKLSEERKDLFGGIYDIRDESDRMGMRAVIELRKDADPERVLAGLYKYSELQDTVGINMVCIADGKPMQLGLKAILEYYLKHRKNVVLRRTRYDLDKAKARAHILEGLIIAVDNLDEVIRLIRSSKTPKEAKEKLMEAFSLTDVQAQAILDMRLQRLTNLEILTLRQEYAELEKLIARLEAILKSEKKLLNVIKTELLELKEKYADPRRTQLVNGFTEKEPEPLPVQAEETVVYTTEAGFIKRMSPKLFEKSLPDINDSAEVFRCDTESKLLFFTDRGGCFTVDVKKVPECKPRDRGLPEGGLLAGLEDGETTASIIPIINNDYSGDMLFASRQGLVKRTALAEYQTSSKRIAACGIKADDAVTKAVRITDETSLLLITHLGMSICFDMSEVPQQGRTAAGVKGIGVADGDFVEFVLPNSGEGEVLLVSEKGFMKRCLLIDYDPQSRGGKGQRTLNFQKNGANGTYLVCALPVKLPYNFMYKQKGGTALTLSTEDIRIERRDSRATMYAMCVLDDMIVSVRAVPDKA